MRPAPGLRRLDASDRTSVETLLREIEPEVVYFPAAEPNVDWCEAEPAKAREANVVPATAMLEESSRIGASFVFFSTDYVFDGAAGPYTEEAAPAPLSEYGRQKLEVERRVLETGGTVIRTTTVYGAELQPGKNFVVRLAARLRLGEVATVPSDQFSTPTWSDELARATLTIGKSSGVWHLAGPDFLSRDRFAVLVAEVLGLDASLIRPTKTDELKQLARRPMRGGLRTEKVRKHFAAEFLPTREALARYIGSSLTAV